MYLPPQIDNAKILITVKTYPLPSSKYEELVCTAGLTEDGKWIRIYAIPFRSKPYSEQYKKYHWVQLNLEKRTDDFRPESYKPRQGIDEPITLLNVVGTQDNWHARKDLVLRDVTYSMTELIARAKGEEGTSLATVKPKEIIDFVVESDERDWKKEWRDQFRQLNLFDMDQSGQAKRKEIYTYPQKIDHRLSSIRL